MSLSYVLLWLPFSFYIQRRPERHPAALPPVSLASPNATSACARQVQPVGSYVASRPGLGDGLLRPPFACMVTLGPPPATASPSHDRLRNTFAEDNGDIPSVTRLLPLPVLVEGQKLAYRRLKRGAPTRPRLTFPGR